MKVNGREINFLRTVAANCKIADLCPEHDIKQAAALFEGSYQTSQATAAKFMAILSEGYEKNKKFSDEEYEPHPLTEEEALNCTDEVFGALFDEALEAYVGEKPTIEVQPKKGKKNSKV